MKQTNKPKSWEKEMRDKVFDILARADGSGMDKTGFINQIMELFHQARQEGIEEILPTLYQIRASIPLTQGMVARKQIKELIEKLELKKKGE